MMIVIKLKLLNFSKKGLYNTPQVCIIIVPVFIYEK